MHVLKNVKSMMLTIAGNARKRAAAVQKNVGVWLASDQAILIF
jgi:hypothetical protein